VLGAAGVGVTVTEHEGPAVFRGLGGELVDLAAGAGVEGEVVQAGAEAVVIGGGHGRRLLDDEVGAVEVPAAAALPVLELLVAEAGEKPAPLGDGAGQVRDPQLHVVQGAGGRALRNHLAIVGSSRIHARRRHGIHPAR
jgi:hypothetical protein